MERTIETCKAVDPIVGERKKTLDRWNRTNNLGVCIKAPKGYDIDQCPYQRNGCKEQCAYQGKQED